MANIKVSIIVPVYNTEKYLRQCLESILAQTLREIEVICVDDGSYDSSPDILREYQQKDSRIKVITKKNDGLGSARNTGIDAAQGEYIGFVDSDDFVDREMFQKLFAAAVENSASVVIGNVFLYFDNTRNFHPYRNNSLYKEMARLSPFKAIEHPVIVENIGVWDRIYRKSFLKAYNLRNPEHVIYEDAVFSFQTSVLADAIVVCPEAKYYYRKNTGIAITDKEILNDSYKFDFIQNALTIKAFLLAQNVYDTFNKNFMKYFLANALWHQSNILNWMTFKTFFIKVRNSSSSVEFNFFIKEKTISWKIKLYLLLLEENLPHLCYYIFSYKRIRIKRSAKHG